MSETVEIFEMGPRDGLQNEKQELSVKLKVELIERLAACGLTTIESGSLPQLHIKPIMEKNSCSLFIVKPEI